jgi:hypothetical protein
MVQKCSTDHFAWQIHFPTPMTEQKDYPEFLVDLPKFKRKRDIGRGKFGLVQEFETMEVEAEDQPVKAVRHAGRALATGADVKDSDFVSYIDVLTLTVQHPALPTFVGFNFAPQRMIFAELLPTSLATIFDGVTRGAPPTFWDATYKSMAVFGIAAAMMHLHAHDFPHGYLCPKNIMFDEHGKPRVVDFYFHKAGKVAHYATYVAPELAQGRDAERR